MTQRQILFPLFPGVTHLDFTGPHQVFSRLADTRVITASMGGQDIAADGLTFSGLADLKSVGACDVICVPGGFGTVDAMGDEAFMAEIRRLAATATYVTSVCTGSLILAAAGLLTGRRAACHWAWRDLLVPFGVEVMTDRVVRDGNIFTGGGVTAGLDFALTLVAELEGEVVAQSIQLALEYAPAPPFESGRPELANDQVLARMKKSYEPLVESRREAALKAAARMEASRKA